MGPTPYGHGERSVRRAGCRKTSPLATKPANKVTGAPVWGGVGQPVLVGNSAIAEDAILVNEPLEDRGRDEAPYEDLVANAPTPSVRAETDAVVQEVASSLTASTE